MNSPRRDQLRISPLHVQQGLFAILALLVTLLIGQQFQRWEQHQDALRVSQHSITSNAYSTVSAPTDKSVVAEVESAQGISTVSEGPRVQKWVF